MKSNLHRILLAVSAVGFALVPFFSRAAPLAVTVGGRSYTVEIAGGTVTVARPSGGSVATFAPGQTVPPEPEIAAAAWTGALLAAVGTAPGSTVESGPESAFATLRTLAASSLKPALAGLAADSPTRLEPLLRAAFLGSGPPAEPVLLELAAAAAHAAAKAKPDRAAEAVETAARLAISALPRTETATGVDPNAAIRVALAIVRRGMDGALPANPNAGTPATLNQQNLAVIMELGNAGYRALQTSLSPTVAATFSSAYAGGFSQSSLAFMGDYGIAVTAPLAEMVGRIAANIGAVVSSAVASAPLDQGRNGPPGSDVGNSGTTATAAQPSAPSPTTAPRPTTPAVDPALNASSSGGG